MASPKKPSDSPARRDPRPGPKLIRLNDLIPESDVTGGRSTVFGSSAPSLSKPGRKPQK